MTYKERLQKEHPEKIDSKLICGCMGCPKDYGYGPEKRGNESCDAFKSCLECWSREIKDEKKKARDILDSELVAYIDTIVKRRDCSVSITIMDDSTTISIYPCPYPEEEVTKS